MSITAIKTSSARSLTGVKRLLPALAAALLGLILLFGVGFAEQPIHNAAHDSRHSFAFACH